MSKCSRCIYGFTGGFGSWDCEYINVTGELRGCPAGDSCTRFEPSSGHIWHEPKSKKERGKNHGTDR